jgi:hypothetical protein
MQRHEALAEMHRLFAPRTYLEVGVADGRSLALSRCRTIGIDPSFAITAPIRCDVSLYRQASDDFFARPEPLEHFGGAPIDLAFIDGMHLFEYALRDFINVERHATPYSVIVFDDMLPRDIPEAARQRVTKFWAGDVFRMIETLTKYRPDLVLVQLDTKPTGMLAVFGPDPTSRVLPDRLDEIISSTVDNDPQDVPVSILERTNAFPAQSLLRSDVWRVLDEARALQISGDALRERLEVAVSGLRRPGLLSRVFHRP